MNFDPTYLEVNLYVVWGMDKKNTQQLMISFILTQL